MFEAPTIRKSYLCSRVDAAGTVVVRKRIDRARALGRDIDP
jgi:hypothetical protein